MTTPIRFDAPATAVIGAGAVQQVPDLAKTLGGTRPLLVTDEGVAALGIAPAIAGSLEAAGLPTAVFTGVQPDPTDANVAAGVEAMRAHEADIVIAVGGGSPIDAAKVISIVPANDAPLPSFMGLHKITNRGLPLIAVPTTAGTGSEATKVAVITDTTQDVKMMMLSAPLQPRAAVVDYELTLTMPRPLTAAVGVDTFTHGLEAFVSKKANAQTDPIALSCLRQVANHLETAWSTDGVSVFAGQRDDPFFFDQGGFLSTIDINNADGSVDFAGLSGTPIDAVAGTNVVAIAVEFPSADVENGANDINIWATTARIDD